MGAIAFLVASAAVEVGSTVMEVSEENAARNAALQQIELQSKESEVQYQQKTLANYDRLQSYLSAQEAAEATRGVGFNSSSFNAIQRNTFNVAAREQHNLDIAQQLTQAQADVKKQEVNEKFAASVSGDVLNIGSMLAGAAYQRGKS